MRFTIYDLRLTRKQTYGARAARPRNGKAELAGEPSALRRLSAIIFHQAQHFRACRFKFASYFISMSTVLEIESAIEKLPPKEKWNLIHRLHDALWQDWDKQIEADAAAGRLDHLVREVEADIAAGRVKPLDEIIDRS
jgi:hypothetical protein